MKGEFGGKGKPSLDRGVCAISSRVVKEQMGWKRSPGASHSCLSRSPSWEWGRRGLHPGAAGALPSWKFNGSLQATGS